MFTKTRGAMLALAAIATLGAATFTSTPADAMRGFGGGGGFHGGGSFHGGGNFRGGGSFHGGGAIKIGGPRVIGSANFHGPKHVVFPPWRRVVRPPNWHWCHWNHRCGIHVRWLPPAIYTAPAAAAVTYAATTAVAPTYNRCTCLTKEYTPEGAVLFKDLCTNEAAINPPSAPVQTGMAPQAPQQ